MRKYFFLFYFLVSAHSLFSQEIPQGTKDNQNQLEQNIENIIESNDNPDIDYTNLIDALNNYKTNPINLNNTNPEELKELGLLSDIQINNLFTHLRVNGKLIVIYELQSIEGFQKQDIDRILPFVFVEDNLQNLNISLSEVFKRGKNTIDLRVQKVLEPQLGYSPISDSLLAAKPNSRYLGNSYKYFARYRFNYGNRVQWGITGEKDPGEEFFKGSQKNGFDFNSGYIFFKNVKKIKALAIGDFRAQFGQGLTLWTDIAFAKTSDILQFKKSAKGIRGFNSINENQYLRGAGITYEVYKNIEISLIGSRKYRDGNVPVIDSLNSISSDEFTSFQLSGFHRTPSEMQDKKTIRETLLASNLTYKTRSFSLGATGLIMEFNKRFSASTDLYNSFNFAGTYNANLGLDFNYVYKNVNTYGEFAQSINGGKALILGSIISLDPKFFINVLYRNYDKSYQAIYTRAIGETIGTQNEQGLLAGFNFKPTNTFNLSGYIDKFKFPYLRYRADAPSNGYDFLVLADWSPTKKIQLTGRFRKRIKPRNTPGTNDLTIDELTDVEQNNFRFNFTYTILPGVRIKNRVEFNSVFPGDTKAKAFLFYQDLNLKNPGSKLSLNLRYAIFDAPDYDARVYMLETDVPYSFSYPSLIGKGQRWYALINYDLTKHIELWLRYSQTYYQGANYVNQGSLNESKGSVRSEIKLHFRYNF